MSTQPHSPLVKKWEVCGASGGKEDKPANDCKAMGWSGLERGGWGKKWWTMQQTARTQGDGLDAANQVRQRGVLQQVLQQLSVRGGDELHAALGDGAARERLRLRANLVHNDNLRHVILNSLHLQPASTIITQPWIYCGCLWRARAQDVVPAMLHTQHHRRPAACSALRLASSPHHDSVLLGRVWHLHAACASNGRVWHIAVAANLIGGVHNDLQRHGVDAHCTQVVTGNRQQPPRHLARVAKKPWRLRTTLLRRSSARTRAISRMTVVLPTPGRPRNSTEFGTAHAQVPDTLHHNTK